MALKEEFSRMQEKIITGAGIVPTVPADLTDVPKDTWLSTDLMTGEICVNPDDDKVWTRTSAGIIEITTSVSTLQDLQSVLDEGSSATIATDFDVTADNTIFNDDDLKIGDNSAAPVTTTNTSKNAVIIAAQNSTIDTGVTNSSINGGSLNVISDSYSVINGGSSNEINGILSSISGGNNNTINGNNSIISGGDSNTIDVNFSFIGGSTSSDITGGQTSAIIGGSDNLITSQWSCITGGINNTISSSSQSLFIGGGSANTISGTSVESAIIAGGTGTIHNAGNNCAIIGGLNHNITSLSRTVILGGNAITANISNAAYVPDLVITKSHAIPANSADAVGDVGSITWDANYLYIKTAAGAWKRTALAAF